MVYGKDWVEVRYLQGFCFIQPDPPANNPGMRILTIKPIKSKDDVLKDKSLLYEGKNCCAKKFDKEDPYREFAKYQYLICERILFSFYFHVNRS